MTGGLHGIYPPTNKSDLWGSELWSYLSKVADVKPMWYGKFLAMPDRPENFNLTGKYLFSVLCPISFRMRESY